MTRKPMKRPATTLALCALLTAWASVADAQTGAQAWPAPASAPPGAIARLWHHFLSLTGSTALAATADVKPGDAAAAHLPGPISILQALQPSTAAPTALSLTRQNSMQTEPPLATSTVTINDAGAPGKGLFYWNYDITNKVVNARDAAGNFKDGPAAISLGLQSSVISSAALNAAFTGHPGLGSQHIAIWATALRKLDTAAPGKAVFTPTKARPYAQLWAQIWNLIDTTNLPSSLGGALLNEDDIAVNNLDDANSRQAFSIDLGNHQKPSATVVPGEVYAGIGMYSFGNDRPEAGAFKSFITMGGNYSVSAIDLRRIRPITTTVSQGLTAPSTVLPVANVLPFTSAGDGYQPPSATNQLAVLINGHRYVCIGYTLGHTHMAAGTITLQTPVSPQDGKLNATVANTSLHAIWLGNGASVAFTDGGGVEVFYDASAKALRFRGANALFDGPLIAGAGGTSLVVEHAAAIGGSLGVRGDVEVAAGSGYHVGDNQVVGARIGGWGSSSNGVRGPLDGRTATPRQTAAALAQLLIDLKTHGLIGQ